LDIKSKRFVFSDDWVTLNQLCALIYICGGEVLPRKKTFRPFKLSLNLEFDSVSSLIGLTGGAYR
jgi:hypothetical protein